MNKKLTSNLLSKIMKWDENKLMEEIPPLQFIAEMKYDLYDHFMPGTRFLGSLSVWLNKFDENERKVMYEFVKDKLVFISSSQMTYLITLMCRVKVQKALINKTAEKLGIDSYKVKKIISDSEFNKLKRLSLFIGLSDGAHMDMIRRTLKLDNEQVITNYYPDKNKIHDISESIQKDQILADIRDKKISNVFLIDDFTASGTSFIREDGDRIKGKLKKVWDKLFIKDNGEGTFEQIISKNVSIHILFCIATKRAITHIKNFIPQLKKGHDDISIYVDCVQLIEDESSDNIKNDKNLEKILGRSTYINNENVLTKSFGVGKGEHHWMGYGDGALPIVLSHNTPNNSILVLWQSESDKDNNEYPSLFPRINRH